MESAATLAGLNMLYIKLLQALGADSSLPARYLTRYPAQLRGGYPWVIPLDDTLKDHPCLPG